MAAGWVSFPSPPFFYIRSKLRRMKIILETLMAGPDGVMHPGEYEVNDKLAADLIKGRHARLVRSASTEKATATPPKVSARPKPENASVMREEHAAA